VVAQVAEQQGKYLAKCLNDEARGHGGTHKPFVYHHLGSMASLGACADPVIYVLGHGPPLASQRAHTPGHCAGRRPISSHRAGRAHFQTLRLQGVHVLGGMALSVPDPPRCKPQTSCTVTVHCQHCIRTTKASLALPATFACVCRAGSIPNRIYVIINWCVACDATCSCCCDATCFRFHDQLVPESGIECFCVHPGSRVLCLGAT